MRGRTEAMRVRRHESAVVRLTGSLNVHTAADLRLVLHAAADDGTGDLIVDLAGLCGPVRDMYQRVPKRWCSQMRGRCLPVLPSI